MKIYIRFPIAIILIVFISGCKEVSKTTEQLTTPDLTVDWVAESGLSREIFHDKVLGFLIGSAIGDAMGAPTEMWSRQEIRKVYGFVEGLDDMIRERSPEGTWKSNLSAGGSTDDTRWKVLILDYLAKDGYAHHPKKFAETLHHQYLAYLNESRESPEVDAFELENSLMKSQWLLEWDKVSKAYLKGDLDSYISSLAKFYGGEMVCAGLLYSPAFGLMYPKQPTEAYRAAFSNSIFDLGYAKDLSAISAAMVAIAMDTEVTPDSLMLAVRLDPEGFFESRLVGRTGYRIWLKAKGISDEAKSLDSLDQGNLFYPPAWQKAYELLDENLQDMPFHAGEISIQVFTAMIISDFDFMKTLIFLT
uniref:ADP-ribosylglycohydrolase family protein n=1 Tax=Aquiflexum sp. TaxID=1872584 RepID=UPI003592EC8F